MKHIRSFNEGKDNKELNKKITNAYKEIQSYQNDIKEIESKIKSKLEDIKEWEKGL